MCSIIGYCGKNMAAPILVKGLKKMEYRGYDSAGISTEYENKIITKKKAGSVSEVNKIERLDKLPGNIGIGHTRWATHGDISDINAHPHLSNSGKIAIVHNGIIDNFSELKKKLQSSGYKFNSDTDSEVIANLLQYNFEKTLSMPKSIIRTISKLKGKYSFIIIFKNKLFVVRCCKPIVIGIKNKSYFIASDILGLSEHTNNIIYLKDWSFASLDYKGINIYDFNGIPIKYKIIKIKQKLQIVSKGKYKHFTLKEIFEQSYTVLKIDNNNTIDRAVKTIKKTKKMYVIGSGSSYNVALVAKYLISKYCGFIVESIVAGEFIFLPDIKANYLLLVISQSGETADIIDAVDAANKLNMCVISIVNTLTSLLTQKSTYSVGINCGPEIGVAATKSFTAQLITIYKLVEKLSKKNLIDPNELSESILNILSTKLEIFTIAKKLKNVCNMYVLGRGMHYPVAAECALKLKELAYIHAESIVGSELKHGSLTLIDSDMYIIAINPKDSTYFDMLININEIKLRGAKIIGVSDVYNEIYDYWIKIPNNNSVTLPILEIVPLQLLAYYLAIEKNIDPDYPRNLAKSITVK